MLLQKIKTRTLLFQILLSVPIAIFWAAIFASFERTPLTGRWRMIILSPEEEDEIAAQLAGPKWYQAVTEVLSAEGTAPKFISPSDWRYQWVQNTLRCLERGIPNICSEGQPQMQYWLERPDEAAPFPPPAQYPLRPRPRASELMHSMCETMCGRMPAPAPHVLAGPPYSLLIVDKPDASNAFSYGFGPDGGGGIVVYSGFLDDILSRVPMGPTSPASEQQPSSSWFSSLFGSLSSVSSNPTWTGPTPEQTAELAILLSHELAHLVLSHHLETLSSGTIIFPAVVSMISDVFRTMLFPITMIFGPFVNDAVAALGKMGSGELTKVGEYCNSVKQEIEADVVSARLLAHAGFDARDAVTFWERRHSNTKATDCGSTVRPPESPVIQEARTLAHRIVGQRHPVDEVRVEKLKGELVRWELERRVALRRRERGVDAPEPGPLLRII
ncbi:hypothetical protein CONPUDRAFT_80361 [Coniophora puteana RWD-64-598 SS2]|uniref:Peptidase M48 domain-containing protein n=1 Tax=Coniophora puteana (strain RWD-64-598) TaxID=741705 RepID=A0A5M3MXE1_CONPW|nr:uncharacterized protein CONPUDRAFT_80361 [Coniophora puteana RWD-64-598 SS2]EIW83758.1 hypothetical protein CONPUDRAFT_80361 [Coniophora puteana RWD-64-598 SS2]